MICWTRNPRGWFRCRIFASPGEITCRRAITASLKHTTPKQILSTSRRSLRTMYRVAAPALPDTHPAVPELSNLFGDRTFLLDSKGLNILEPAEETPRGGVQPARVINLANWGDENLNKISPHEPAPTGAVVE